MTTNLFKDYLKSNGFSNNTITSYIQAIKNFQTISSRINQESLQDWKLFLIENYQPKTVNLRLMAMNKFLEFCNHADWKLTLVKVQQVSFLDNIMENEEYLYFKEQLKKNKYWDEYFAVWIMASTGARISELLQFRVEHIRQGYIDVISKGNKIRRLYLSDKLREECISWLKRYGIGSGWIFRNRVGELITTRGLAHQIKKAGREFGFDTEKIHPHAFRHLFAKMYLEKCNDIALLSDLMGHSSIETTRIYLRKSSNEQRNIITSIIDW